MPLNLHEYRMKQLVLVKSPLYVCVIYMLLLSWPVVAKDEVDCAVFRKEIQNELIKPATCYRDEECHTVSWGCPWQPSPCHVSIYSDADKQRNVALSKIISQYQSICVSRDKALKAQCDEFYADPNPECKVYPALMCYKGKCVTPVAGIVQGISGGEDIYGSREIIEE